MNTQSSQGNVGHSPRYPHRNAAIRAGRLRGQRSIATRTKYRTLIETLARRGAGCMVRPPICEKAVGTALESMGESEAHEGFVKFCRRASNHAWVNSIVLGASA
jgi:hypothetical protein